jgi:hypothetical protein
MKVQRDQKPDARGVVFGLFAIIVICTNLLASVYRPVTAPYQVFRLQGVVVY